MDTSNLSPAAIAALAAIGQAPVADPVVEPPPPPVLSDIVIPDEISDADMAHAMRSEHGMGVQQNQAPAATTLGQIQSTRNAGMESTVVPVKLTSAQLRAQLAAAEKEEADSLAAYRKSIEGDGSTFHTRIPNSTFIVQKKDADGKAVIGQTRVLQFKGHALTIPAEDHDALDQIREISDVPGSMIYTRPGNANPTAEELQAFNEVKSQAGDTVAKIAAAGGRA